MNSFGSQFINNKPAVSNLLYGRAVSDFFVTLFCRLLSSAVRLKNCLDLKSFNQLYLVINHRYTAISYSHAIESLQHIYR